MPQVKVRPEAEFDAIEASAWYDSERTGLGLDFLDELQAVLLRIERGPQQFPIVFQDVRRAILSRFPFGVFFVSQSDVSTVLAIVHLHRQPAVWQSRRWQGEV